jgi:hypothetical protein
LAVLVFVFLAKFLSHTKYAKYSKMNDRRPAYYNAPWTNGFRSRPYYGPTNTSQNSPEYWEGPYGIMVPSHVDMVPYTDGTNMIYKDGTISNVYADGKKLNQLRYMALYGNQGRDGRWYYDNKKAMRSIF